LNLPLRKESEPPQKSVSEGSAESVQALFVLNSLNIGGSETKTVRVVNAMARRDIRAGIAYLNGSDELAAALEPDVPVWHLQRRGKFSSAALRSLRILLREQRPRVVLAMSLYPALYVSLATMGMKNRARTVALINTTDFREGRKWEPFFYRPFLRQFDDIVYGCELQRSRWPSLQRRLRPRSSVIYNGVDTEYFAPAAGAGQSAEARKRLGIGPQAFVIGSVGRLAPEKNQTTLIDALAELHRRSVHAHLLLVGEGRRRSQLERRIVEREMQPHVTLLGMQKDVRPALAAMDVFVLPSTRVETFSNAALEAMAMARPVVLSRIGGSAEMVRDGVEGFTIEVADLDASLAPLLARLQADRALREEMGRKARERVERQFSLRAMVDGYVSLLDVEPTYALR
jgi:glycosyltransferase involved in cell wall biosynthesis